MASKQAIRRQLMAVTAELVQSVIDGAGEDAVIGSDPSEADEQRLLDVANRFIDELVRRAGSKWPHRHPDDQPEPAQGGE